MRPPSLGAALTLTRPPLHHSERWTHLAAEFRARFGRPPAFIARAPGRVNLIGEHIDYALFGVLPAAVERDILIACAPRAPASAEPAPKAVEAAAAAPAGAHGAGLVMAENLHPKYGPQTFAPVRKRTLKQGACDFRVRRATGAYEGCSDAEEPTDAEVHVEEWHLDIDKRELRWESYVKAGYFVRLFVCSSWGHALIFRGTGGVEQVLPSVKVVGAPDSGGYARHGHRARRLWTQLLVCLHLPSSIIPPPMHASHYHFHDPTSTLLFDPCWNILQSSALN